ncbi:Hsp33 family molecular chaperone HslO [Ectothiorhodospiraceae bacterium WFHF3C12]|nr:Hsp33 family molecular chaperone HslO [Ectothiorhodospiraceae bacterium WFHF3C12]
MSQNDHLYRFLFEGAEVRGELVQLNNTYAELTRRADYPAPVRDLLGRALAAAALLTATIKFRGRLTLQVQGGGPVNLLVIQASSDGNLRGMARYEGRPEADGDIRSLCAEGTMAITIEPEGRESYQGVVDLTAGSLADVLEGYFLNSEQLPTRVYLSADAERAAGMLLQQMPEAGEDADAWPRVQYLADTVTDEELMGLGATDVLHRLFHEEDLRLFDPTPFRFLCKCSRERVGNMLYSLGSQEVQETLEQEGQVEVTCDFCNAVYRFDAVDVDQLFAEAGVEPGSQTRH